MDMEEDVFVPAWADPAGLRATSLWPWLRRFADPPEVEIVRFTLHFRPFTHQHTLPISHSLPGYHSPFTFFASLTDKTLLFLQQNAVRGIGFDSSQIKSLDSLPAFSNYPPHKLRYDFSCPSRLSCTLGLHSLCSILLSYCLPSRQRSALSDAQQHGGIRSYRHWELFNFDRPISKFVLPSGSSFLSRCRPCRSWPWLWLCFRLRLLRSRNCDRNRVPDRLRHRHRFLRHRFPRHRFLLSEQRSSNSGRNLHQHLLPNHPSRRRLVYTLFQRDWVSNVDYNRGSSVQ